MRRIEDVFEMCGQLAKIDRIVPEPEDVVKALGYADAIAAFELMLVSEDYIRQHLRIGSTPPTRVAVWNVPEEHRRLQDLVYKHFGETFICG